MILKLQNVLIAHQMLNKMEEKIKSDVKDMTKELVMSFANYLSENGIDEETALTVAKQTVLGSAEMIKTSGVHPSELIDRVCSPGGTTIEGLLSLQKNGFEKILIEKIEGL